jgi:hypothetical protein
MKRILIVLATVLMLGMVAFAPYAPASSDEVAKSKRTPTPTAVKPTPSPVNLTAPVLLAPENGATIHTGNLTFSWSPVVGAARYHFQAGSGTAFDQQFNILENWSLTEPSYTFNVTSGFVFYFPRLYWRVQAIDANNVQGPWSEVRVIYLVSP